MDSEYKIKVLIESIHDLEAQLRTARVEGQLAGMREFLNIVDGWHEKSPGVRDKTCTLLIEVFRNQIRKREAEQASAGAEVEAGDG